MLISPSGRTCRATIARGVVVGIAVAVVALLPATPAEASPTPFNGIARVAAPLVAHLDDGPVPPQQQEAGPRLPPPVADPAGGSVISIMGGTVFSGSSSFQGGGAFAHFFGDKATFGFEVEGTLTFGPGGRVGQVLGSAVIQVGARTSKFVPYFAFGGGYVYAKANLPVKTAEVLETFGIRPSPTSESGPLVQYGGGVRFYVKPNLAFRGDVRFAQVLLDLKGRSFSESLFPMRRIAGMVSWDF